MTTIIPVASGKGGVGKTIFVANLGVNLAARGKTIVLVDLDLGASNLHTCLGMKNNHLGIGHFIHKKETNLEALLVATEVDRLHFIPGDCLLPGTANLPFFIKQRIIRGILGLIADFVILDLGSGTAFNTLDFFLISATGIIVTTPETTSVLNAYSFLKNALYRLLLRSYPKNSPEREMLQSFMGERIEGSSLSIQLLLEQLGKLNPEASRLAQAQIHALYPRVVLNMGQEEQDLALGGKLRGIARRNLGVELQYIGFLRRDENVARSILARKPLFLLEPRTDYIQDLDQVARQLLSLPNAPQPRLYEADEDLLELQQINRD